jgi:galactonate dehydratase
MEIGRILFAINRRNNGFVMKIQDVETFLVHDGDVYNRNWILCKITTTDGLEGWGEAGISGKDLTLAAAIKESERYLKGKDPINIEEHWQYIYRQAFFRGGSILCGALSAIEHALWDITGKHFNTPVYNLLGGKVRDKIRVYARGTGSTPEELVANVMESVKEGYDGVKFFCYGGSYLNARRAALLKEAIERVSKVREAVGDNVDIMVDCGGRTPSEAIAIGRGIEEYNPLFLEEPVLPENYEALAKVAAHINIPIATGERLYTRFEFRRILELGAVDVVQPDLCNCGGILEGKKIAAMAEAYYAYCAPHNPLSPISTAVAVQLDACIPNFLIQEYLSDTKPFREPAESFARKELLIDSPLKVENSYIKVPTKPGLGIEVNEEVFKKYPYKPWDSIFAGYCEDGSLGGWPATAVSFGHPV